ncbi:hypothetical protein AB0K00_35535 [Dactylosporangium sp. NPDC049525]|uniref:TolB family protein n=1 Tax=Dactylosporangium sp. NPDC049525 TaxID=3154730 RepID=UPI00341E071D
MRISRLVPAVVVLGTILPIAAPAGAAPAASVGGGELVFQAEAAAGDLTQNDLYVIRSDGSHLRRLTTTPDRHEFGPAWNATGTRIAFWRTPAPFGPGAVWTMRADGTDQRQLTHGVDARDPVWDPTGTRIAFTLVGPDGFHLATMRAADGGDLRVLTSGPDLDFEPAWSPDGTRLAFTRGSQQGDAGDVYLLDLGTGAVRQVTASPDYDHQVAWSPDGRRLVFERDVPTASSVWTVDPDGTHLRQVTSGPYFDTGPTFSPDGRRIAFGSNRTGTFLDDLWAVNTDGTGPRLIRHLPDSESFPDWT